MGPAFAVEHGSPCGDCIAELRSKGSIDGHGLRCLQCAYGVRIAGGRRIYDNTAKTDTNAGQELFPAPKL